MATVPAQPTTPVSTLTPQPQPPALSQGARIVNTFIAPSKTFTDLRRSASWWAPWLLISVFSILFVYAMQRQIGFDQVNRNQMNQSPKRAEQFEKLSPEQQAQQMKFGKIFLAGVLYGTPAIMLLVCLISTTVIWATLKVAASAETSFGQAYAITMYASLPGIIGAILGIVSFFAGVNPEGFDLNNPVGTNLAYYLDPASTGKFVHVMASALDVLTVWTIVLIGIGYACTSKVKRSTAIIIVVVWYLAFKLLSAGLAAAFS